MVLTYAHYIAIGGTIIGIWDMGAGAEKAYHAAIASNISRHGRACRSRAQCSLFHADNTPSTAPHHAHITTREYNLLPHVGRHGMSPLPSLLECISGKYFCQRR